jgi:hypothetical protein
MSEPHNQQDTTETLPALKAPSFGDASGGTTRPTSLYSAILYFAHLVGSTVFTAVVAGWMAALIWLIRDLLHTYPRLDVSYFYWSHQLVWNLTVGLVAGYIANYWSRSRLPSWVWIVPTISLGLAIGLQPPSSVLGSFSFLNAYNHFFGACYLVNPIDFLWRGVAPPRFPCHDQLLFTVPFYCSVSYSIGAWAARHSLLKALFTFSHPEPES